MLETPYVLYTYGYHCIYGQNSASQRRHTQTKDIIYSRQAAKVRRQPYTGTRLNTGRKQSGNRGYVVSLEHIYLCGSKNSSLFPSIIFVHFI